MRWRTLGTWRLRPVWWWLLGLGLLLVAARLAAPALIAAKVRSSIETLRGGYRGTIDGVELSVLAAEVAILGMRIEKTNGQVPVPFMRVKRFVLGVQRDGYELRQTLRLVSLDMSYVDAESKASEQWGPEFELRELRESLPLELGAVYLHDGQIHFRNFEADPPMDIYAHDLELAWEELGDCLPPGGAACRSSLRAKGRVQGSAAVSAAGGFDRQHGARFDVVAQLRNLKLEALNPLLLEYAKIDAQSGSADATVLYDVRDEAKRLVIVPRLHDVKVTGGERERTGWFRELAAGVAAGFFERNRGEKAIAYERSGARKGDWTIVDWPRPAKRGG